MYIDPHNFVHRFEVSTVDEGAGRLRLPSLGASAMKVIPYRQLIEDFIIPCCTYADNNPKELFCRS